MNKLTVKAIRSDKLYLKIMQAPPEKKDDIFRYEFMKLFEKKWDIYHIPLKAATPNGYDIIMANKMLGNLTPDMIDEGCLKYIKLLSDEAVWERCTKSIENALELFEAAGIELRVREYLVTLMLMNPESPYAITSDNYLGDGGIPGYISGALVPSEYTLSRLGVLFAHETNHNVRFQFIQWKNDITLGEYMVSEGLAENFAASIYGCENVGPWVKKTDSETLNEYIKPLMIDALDKSGMDNISSYMYGDELAKLQNYIPAGMPYCAGYACGYYMVKYYLKKTGKSIVEATILPAHEILDEIAEFWTSETDTSEEK